MCNWLRRIFGTHESPETFCPDLSEQDLRERADQVARAAGLPGADEAFRKLDAGELDGTLLEMELHMIRFLEGGAKDRPRRGEPAHA